MIVLRVLFLLPFLFPSLAVSKEVPFAATGEYQLAQQYSCGKTCGKVRSCKEAVYQWCVCGYRPADGDNDGVPCEKHCGQSTKPNLDRVKKYKSEFGCR